MRACFCDSVIIKGFFTGLCSGVLVGDCMVTMCCCGRSSLGMVSSGAAVFFVRVGAIVNAWKSEMPVSPPRQFVRYSSSRFGNKQSRDLCPKKSRGLGAKAADLRH